MSKVTFLSIGIQNFGPFRERQRMDLSTSGARPVILVQAFNGSGKTTLLTCLQVALYGAKALGSARSSEYEQLIRGLHRADATDRARIDLALRIELNGEKEDLEVSREWTVTPSKLVEQLSVSRNGSIDFHLANDWDEYFDGILPCELLQLFLFDGEKIESLANPTTLPEMLRRATEAFLGIGGIDHVTKDLAAVERRTLLQAKQESAEYEAARHELDEMEAHLAQLHDRIDILLQTEASTAQALEAAQSSYNKFASAAQRAGLSAYEKAADIRAAEQAARTRVTEARDELRAVLADPFLPLSALDTLWQEYEKRWSQESETRTSRHLLSELRDRDARVLQSMRDQLPADTLTCVGNALSQDAERYVAKSSLPVHLAQAPSPADLRPLIHGAKKKHEEAATRLDTAKSALSSLEQQVAAIPQGDQLTEMLADLAAKSAAVAAAELQLTTVCRELAESRTAQAHASSRIESARARMARDFQGHALEAKAVAAGRRARAVLAAFKERLLSSKAVWLSEMITAEFKKLMRKQRLVSRVHVDPISYEVHIIGGDGHELPMKQLSAGERQLLAIAVLSALIRKRKGRFPVVVDTPLARLDRAHRQALVKNFFAKVSHQVMVLSTDEEVEGSVYSEMEQHTSRAFVIHFSDDERRSTICPQQFERECA